MERRIIHNLTKGLKICECWYVRYQQRRQLLALDDQMLKDIGLTRATAQQEGNKPFWRQ